MYILFSQDTVIVYISYYIENGTEDVMVRGTNEWVGTCMPGVPLPQAMTDNLCHPMLPSNTFLWQEADPLHGDLWSSS